jgi:hypothetical protein
VIEDSHLKNAKIEDTHYKPKENKHALGPLLPQIKENRKLKELSKAK